MDNASWEPWAGKVVVVDTSTPFVYLGTFARADDHFVILTDVDAHDRNEGPSTKEQYIMDTKRFGVKANRKEVSVRKSVIVSVSLLEDVLTY